MITIVLSPVDSRGVAEIVDGRYVLDSHGVLTPIDKATYESRMLIDRQAIFSILGVFGVLTALDWTARIRLAADDGDDSDDSRPAPSRLLRP